ncbi:MAG TPA: ferric reductase-like transmembrane domain-containing protein [Jatrophihabitantaceae bacterium]|jgi:predicted ferric reductase|nr:ferric reductase-like transmembrane domain-containing protein [Jatrophihabitantaceae bacterium]
MTAILNRSAPRSARSGGKVSLPPWVALALIVAGTVAILLLWFQDTTYVSGFGSWLTNAGRITGLLAGYAIAVLLALMARVPALERGLGADRLARWHAMGGRYTVSLAVAHTLLIIWGYAVTAHTNVVHESTSLVLTYPDVLMATVAVFLLLGVGIASARAARKKLSYETWHFIHLYTYLAVALAFSHQFSTGADFISNIKARWLWSALYIVVAALLFWYRLVTPIRAAFRHRLQVVDVRRESTDVVTVFIGGRHLQELDTEAGQFFRWRFLTRELWWAANPYSLSAAPRPTMLRVTVKVAGTHSAALFGVKPGTRVFAEGPYGAFTAARRKRRKVLLLAGGVGITPLRALFETLPADPGDITMIYRANTADDLVLRTELDWIAHERGAHVHYLLGRPQAGNRDHLSAERLRKLVPDVRERDVFLCGPAPMMIAARAGLKAAGVPRRHIHHESFTF